MSLTVTSLKGTAAAASDSAVDFSKLLGAPTRLASTRPGLVAPKPSLPVRTAMGPTSIGLNPEEVKDLSIAFLPKAEKRVDTIFAKYILSPPKLQLKFWTPQELTAAKKSNVDSLFAFVDSNAPATVNVGYQSIIFKNFNIDANDTRILLMHEVLHTRSAAFALNIARTYGMPLADGKPASFSDGSLVRGVTEGLTEIFTMEAMRVDGTPAAYGRETKRAFMLIDKLGTNGMEIAKNAYFRNDVASMVQVKKAIAELVAEDKKAPESPSARSTLPSPIARSLSAGTGRSA